MLAQGIVDQVTDQLRAQGYSTIELHRTLLGRTRIVAINGDGSREIIINPNSGEILRDLWEPTGSTTSGPVLSNNGKRGGTENRSQSGSGSGTGGGNSDRGGSGGSDNDDDGGRDRDDNGGRDRDDNGDDDSDGGDSDGDSGSEGDGHGSSDDGGSDD